MNSEAPGADPLAFAAVLKSPEQRRAELRRMRAIATTLLIVMTLIFLATRRAPASWAWAPYLGAFSEAGMVGACADWFAVVALFRHPLGIPIPHTAVVPENKRRIGAALGRFIANNFLSTRVAAARLAAIDPVGIATQWLTDERNAQAIASAAGRLVPHAIDAMPREAVADWVATVARRGVEAIPVAPLASRGLAILWAQGAAQILLDQGVDFAEAALARNKAAIVRQVRSQSSPWIPRWVDDMIASRVIHGLAGMLHEMRAPNHPWRRQVRARMAALIETLAHDPEMRERGEALKREMLDNPVFAEQAKELWGELEASLRNDLPSRAEAIAQWAIAALAAFGRWLEEDPARRARVNRAVRNMALRAILPRRAEIGAYIAEVVDRWDTATLVNRMELQVGKDLQYIRINGTLVGGLVGLLIFTVSRALGG
jgi:uncharacterized membrane-anchored protein YjiN (DUF445 family)